jgi:hypothetical protein
MAAISLAQLFPHGKKTAQRLLQLSIHSTDDLLRMNRRRLSTAAREFLTIEDIDRAQSLASLLEINGMDLRWAKVLVDGGIQSITQLSRRSFDDILKITGKKKSSRSALKPPVIAAWLQDATVLANTGVLNGSVNDAQGKPIVGARVRCFHHESRSDGRGRFRLLRLPLWHPVGVLIEKSGFAPERAEVGGLTPPHVLQGRKFRLRKQAETKKRVLSELAGDILPPLDGTTIRSKVVKVNKIPARELVRFVEFTKRGQAKLTSCYLRYGDGEFQIVVYSVARALVPPDVQLGTYFRSDGKVLRQVTMSAHSIAVAKALRRIEKSSPLKSRRGDLKDKVRYMRLKELRKEGLLHPAKKTVGKPV